VYSSPNFTKLYFYDLETGLLSHHVPTESTFIAGVYDLSNITHKEFNIGYITTHNSSINLVQPMAHTAKQNKIDSLMLDP
jgi:hypothetical protein